MATRSTTTARHPGIPFGERDGRLYAPSDVARGRSCRCRCPGCDSPLRANQGLKRRHYFSHDAVQGAGCLESAVHRYAKQVLADASLLSLPAWAGGRGLPNPPFAGDGEGRLVIGDRVEWPARTAAVDNGRQEVGVAGMRVDVVFDDADGLLLVEVHVSHAVDEAKAERVRQLGCRMLEIDLSSVGSVQPDGFADWVLHHAPRRWVWHPQAVGLWQESKDRVQAIIGGRTPVFGPGAKMLVRLGGGRADAVRLRVDATADEAAVCRTNPLVGAWVWLEGEGAVELTDVVDASRGVFCAVGESGQKRLVCLGRSPEGR